MNPRFLTVIVSAMALAILPARSAEVTLHPKVTAWLAAQTNIQTWSADFIQTRTLKTLTQPLTATGHVHFAAPNRFRWELGNPPQTIALRAPTELLVIYPRLKRVEHFPLTGPETGSWRGALSLLEAGFPRSAQELVAQYDVLSQNVTNQTAAILLQPKSPSARRMMRRVEIVFDTLNHALLATELEFADGSTMRNDFKKPMLNPPIGDSLFRPDIPADYKHSEPLRSRK